MHNLNYVFPKLCDSWKHGITLNSERGRCGGDYASESQSVGDTDNMIHMLAACHEKKGPTLLMLIA